MKRHMRSNSKGVGLIIVILVMTFLLAVGILLLYITGTGPKIAGNIRWQDGALNAAEAGFDTTWRLLNNNFLAGAMTDFSAECRTTYGGAGKVGLDDPASPNYFRKRTDEELFNDVLSTADHEIFSNQPMPSDNRFTYTVFLVNDEGGAFATTDPRDCVMICIGRGPRNTYVRLEIVIEIQT